MKPWWALAAMLTLISPAHAQDFGDSDKPIEITANSLEVFQKESRAVFSGKVEAVQGNTKLTADRMVVHYRAGGENTKDGAQRIRQVDVEGNVFMATPRETAKGTKGVYHVDQKLIRLYGNVVLTQGKSVVKGDALEYNMASGYSRIVSGKLDGAPAGTPASGGRVKGLFVPQ